MPELIETGEWNGLPFFVMELIEGVDYPISAKAYRAFCVEAFTALEELHLAGLLHCDLTPAHLGWKNGKLAFIDFDSAHTFAQAVKNKDCIGTDPYIAPEVASRGEISKQSDLYSLAMILIERCPEKLRDCFEPVLLEDLQRERVGSGLVHDDVVGPADEIAGNAVVVWLANPKHPQSIHHACDRTFRPTRNGYKDQDSLFSWCTRNESRLWAWVETYRLNHDIT